MTQFKSLLNHINIPVYNVPELTRFFQQVFGFRLVDQRGAGTFSVLVGEDNFNLVLSHDKTVGPDTYPKLFHIGFLQESASSVQELYQRFHEAGFDAPAPVILTRGGPPAYGFYYSAPGVIVEVSTFAIEPETV